ncbi:MAG: glycosyltransferase family A protein [Firmicutes bacterium]|nr:glycosyltransferase family A protein [Bacillota bacterium]
MTVVIPTYGHADFIATALDSVLRQTLAPDEVWVINDGSPDATDAAVAPYLPRIRYVVQNHQGVSATLNRSLEWVTTDCVMFLASDDWLEPNALEVLYAGLKAHPEVGVAHANRGKWVNGVPLVKDAEVLHYGVYTDLPRLILRYSVYAPAVLWRTAALHEILPIPPYPYCQDWWMSIQVALKGWPFLGIEDILGHYRRHEGNTTHPSRLGEIVRDEIAMLTELVNSGQLSRALVDVAERAISDRQRVLAWRCVETGQYEEARRLFWRLAQERGGRVNAAAGLLASWMPRTLYLWSREVRRRGA